MTTANLGFAIDSGPLAATTSELDKLTSSAAKAEQAAAKVSNAGTRMSRGFGDLSPALDKIIGSLGRLETATASIDKRLEAMAAAAGRTAKSNGALQQSAIEASTAYKQLEASLNAMQAAQSKADAAQAKSLSQIDKQREAIARLNAELQKLRTAPPPVPGNQNNPGGKQPKDNSVFAATNVVYQAQDVIAQAMSGGASPLLVGFQQGPQAAMSFAGMSAKQAMSTLGMAATQLVSPINLAAVGITAAASAAIGYGASLLSAATKTETLDDALERHDGILKRLDARYGALSEKARGFAVDAASVLNFQSGADIRSVRRATNSAQYDVFNQTGNILPRVRGGTQGGNDLNVSSTYKPIEDALRRLRAGAKDGKPDFDAFYESLDRAVALDPKFAKKADELSLLVEQFRQGTKALQEMQRIQRAVFNDRGPNGMLLSQGASAQADSTSLTIWQNQQRVAAQRRQQAFNAQIASLNANTPQQREDAARATASAVYNPDESASDRRDRIAQAAALARAQAEKQIADAQRDRALNLDKMIEDQKQEIALTGRTAGSVVALRKEYELTSSLRLEAAQKGMEVDQQEIDLIKQKTAELGHLIDAQALMMSRTNAAAAAQKYQDGNTETLFYLRRQQGAAMAGVGARSPSQIAEAARRRAEAEPVNPNESSEVRQYRIDSAANLARAQAEQQLSQARDERTRNLDKVLKDQQSEIDLIGKTGGAAAALRKEYELTSALRLEAARQGIDVDQRELDLIKQRAAELGKLTDQYNQARFTNDMRQQASDARLSPIDRQVTTTLRQYGLPEDLKGQNAQTVRQQIRSEQQKQAIDQFSANLASNIIQSGGKIGKAFAQTFLSSLQDVAQKQLMQLFSSLFNGLLGNGSGGGASGLGAVGTAIGGFLGGKTAANNNAAGGYSSLAASGVGQALGFVGNYKSGVDTRLTDILNTAAQRTPGFKVDAMSGFRAGDPRFHGKGLATDVQLTDLASGKMLGNYQDASSFRQYEKFAQTARQVQMEKYPELADQFRWGGYFGGPKGKYGAADTMHFDLGGAGMAGGSWAGGLNSRQMGFFPGAQSQGMGTAADAVNKLAESAGSATKGLDTMAGGLGKLGSSLSSSVGSINLSPSSGSAVGQYSGLWGSIGKLFGGISPTSPLWAPNTTFGKVIGAYADGTSYSPGGMAVVGERGPELVNLPQGSQVFNTNRSAQMMAGNQNQRGGGRPAINVHLYSATGNTEIRSMVDQGVQSALTSYDTEQRRKGFGSTQAAFNSDRA